MLILQSFIKKAYALREDSNNKAYEFEVFITEAIISAVEKTEEIEAKKGLNF